MNKKSIAVIGSGISGLSASFLLSKDYDVHLFEKNKILGGHTRTINVKENNINIPIDTGFIVFNEKTYPDLTNFFKLLEVEFKNSNMSFAVSNNNPKIEYSGRNLRTIFSSPKNFFSIKFLKMLREIFILYNLCDKLKIDEKLSNLTLEEFLDKNNFSDYLKKYHIFPMVSSIWSSNNEDVKNFPLVSFINFFNNHGLFAFKNRPEWKYVEGGSNEYIKKILDLNLFKYKTNFIINSIERKKTTIKITDSNNIAYKFDKLVLATHADQALQLLNNPSSKEREVLSSFKYTKNYAFLHSDEKMMPKKNIAWSGWNFIENIKSKDKFMLTYWMNLLQNIPSKNNYFVTINPSIEPKSIIDSTVFEHPTFSFNTLKAQKNLLDIQGTNNTYYCGSYFGYGFHEDGIQSSVYIAKLLDVKIPWLRNNNFYNRLQF